MAAESRKTTAKSSTGAEEAQPEAAVEEQVAPEQEPVAQEAPPAAPVRKIARERLIAQADAYAGVPPHVMAGALAEVEGEEFTVDEARQRAVAWLAS